MSIRGGSIVGFVATTDFGRAKVFYADQLGFELIRDDDFALVFRCGLNMLRVVKVDEFKPQEFTVLGWEVKNIEDRVRGLRQHDIEFVDYPFFEQDELGIWQPPGGDKVAWFKDPDGNLLSVSEHSAGI